MSGTNDYQLYAGSAGANVITQAQYLALTSILANGMSDGIVPSAQFNKILRQLSMGSAALGKIIADNNVNAVDDGNVSDFVSKLLAALNTLLAIPTVPPFATNAEAQAGIDTTSTITPASLASALKGSNQSLSANGYQKFPGGLILQWGRKQSPASGSTDSFTYPISFPNGVFAGCFMLETAVSAFGSYFLPTNTGASLGVTGGSLFNSAYYRWLTIGY